MPKKDRSYFIAKFLKKVPSRHFAWFGYDLVDVEVDDKYSVIIECPIHGPFIHKKSSHLRSETPCRRCANLVGALKRQLTQIQKPRLVNLSEGKRKCSRCGEWKELELNFRFYGRKRKHWTSKCNDCLKERARQDKRPYEDRRDSSNRYYHSEKGKDKRLKNELKKQKHTAIKIVQCECGIIEVRRDKQQKRGSKCKRCYARELARSYYTPTKHRLVCNVCNSTFVSTNPIVKFCSDKCRAKNEKIKKKEARKEMGRHNHRSRARHYGVYYEPVNRAKVFKRDKWRCKECGVKVQNKKTNVDDEATLGHIVPLSKGGSHSYANVQCECRKCNTMKGDKVAGQQTTIFFGRGASI